MTSTEWGFLRDALIAPGDAKRLQLAAVTLVNWRVVYEFARDNGLSSILYRSLVSVTCIPEEFKRWLAVDYYAAQARFLLLNSEASRLLEMFAAEEIEVILLKGLALNESLYNGARPMGDIDLLVRHRDTRRAGQLLELQGYEHRFTGAFHPRTFDEEFGGQLCYWAPLKSAITIDLHYDVFGSEWVRHGTRLDHAGFWVRRRELRIGETRVWQLGLSDMLLHLCQHTAQHAFFALRSSLDIHRLVEREQINWAQFVTLVQQSRMSVMIYLALWLNFELWSTAIPADVLQQLRPHGLRHWLLMKLLPLDRCREGTAPIQLLHGRYLLHLLWCDGWLDLGRMLGHVFFPGPRWLAKRYGLHGRLRSYLACLWHPFLVFWRGVLGLWELVKAKMCCSLMFRGNNEINQSTHETTR